MYKLIVTDYIIYFVVTLSSQDGKETFRRDGRIFDFSVGKFVGHLFIPAPDKCHQSTGQRHLFLQWFQSIDMITFATYCDKKLTIYTTLWKTKNGKLFCTLLTNNTVRLVNPLINLQVFRENIVRFLFESDAGVTFISDNTLRFVIMRNIHQGSSVKQWSPPWNQGRFTFLSADRNLGIFLGRFASSPLQLSCFKITPFTKITSSLHMKEEAAVQRLKILGSVRLQRKQKFLTVTIDQQFTIFQIHHRKREQVYDGIKVYKRMSLS
jgi:hypothetical protein